MRLKFQVFNVHETLDADQSRYRLFASKIFKGEDWHGAVDVNIIFCDDVRICDLNKRFLGTDSATDVIAFPLNDRNDCLEGEIYISLDRAAEQANDYKVSFENELDRLVAHGLLHLLGYKDDSPENRKKMHAREDFYLAE